MSTRSADEVRAILLDVIKESAERSEGAFSREDVINTAARALGGLDTPSAFRLLDAWDDLYRGGIVGRGANLDNQGGGWCHVTEFGERVLAELDRDPSNPAGYNSIVASYLANEPVAASYLSEALATFNTGTFRASAVMLGCAAEALHLSLRDRLVAKIQSAGKTPPAYAGARASPRPPRPNPKGLRCERPLAPRHCDSRGALEGPR